MLPKLPHEIESLNRYVSATFIKTGGKKSHNKNSRSDNLINSSLI